jgi:TolA-binding protein
LRREGDAARAQRLYRALQQRYPRSPEVEVSRVSLGRVELELGAARAALDQFERYLSKRPRGPLAEEALFGKASALERLDRAKEERSTWEQLLATFPGSLYAERARMRLGVLPVPSTRVRDPMP